MLKNNSKTEGKDNFLSFSRIYTLLGSIISRNVYINIFTNQISKFKNGSKLS